MRNDYPLTKVDWLVAGFLFIPSSVGLVIIRKGGEEFAVFSSLQP
jgi:hypothetical protein